jgi:hypothetical protein
MRVALPNNSIHNPFNNRFNDPVTRRHDDMQAYAYMVWLRDRNQATCNVQSPERTASATDAVEHSHGGRTFGFALFLVVLSLAVLLRAL